MASVTIKTPNVVYGLHVGDGRFHYIGSTTSTAQQRRWEHVYRARTDHDAPVYQWMREVGVDNVRVSVVAVPSSAVDLETLEALYITRLLKLGHPLQNQMSVDGVLYSLTPDSRLKQSEAMRGKTPWIKGRSGEEAGWTDARRKAMAERSRIKAQNREPKHGTFTEYANYGCRCAPCKAVHSAHQAQYRARRGR